MLRYFFVYVLSSLAVLARAETFKEQSQPAAGESNPANRRIPDPLLHWEFDYESGIFWKIGEGATPLSYTVISQLLTWKSPTVFRVPFLGGDLIMRSRYSLLLEPIIKGPERYYVGVSGSGSLEWWNSARSTSVFFASGGGFGVMHSKGHQIAGAQGQDLNFNWLLYLGARKRWRPGTSGFLGLYFQHISNTGLDKINPGLNALGPMAGISWHF